MVSGSSDVPIFPVVRAPVVVLGDQFAPPRTARTLIWVVLSIVPTKPAAKSTAHAESGSFTYDVDVQWLPPPVQLHVGSTQLPTQAVSNGGETAGSKNSMLRRVSSSKRLGTRQSQKLAKHGYVQVLDLREGESPQL